MQIIDVTQPRAIMIKLSYRFTALYFTNPIIINMKAAININPECSPVNTVMNLNLSNSTIHLFVQIRTTADKILPVNDSA